MKIITPIPLRINPARRSTDAEGDLLLRPGESVALAYRHDGADHVRHVLRLVGEAGTNWQERSEAEQPAIWYRSLEDAMDRTVTCNGEVSLHLKGKGEAFERNAWFMIPGRPWPKGATSLDFHVWARTRNLNLGPQGMIGAFLEIYHHRQGRHSDDVYDTPDRVLALALKPGTKGWTKLAKKLTRLDQIAAILVRVGGSHFSGEAWLGTPVLMPPRGASSQTGRARETPAVSRAELGSLIRPFNTPVPLRPRGNWLGENLSRKEWPEFRIRINGHTVFRGPVFCPIVRDPDLEFPLPGKRLKKGINRIEVSLQADYPSAPGYVLRRAEVLRESARPFEIVACPEYARVGARAPVLVEINQPGLTLKASDGWQQTFTKPGLQVVPFRAETLVPGATLTDGTRTEKVGIRRAVVKKPDILLGSGDAVYIPQTVEAFRRFLKWYLAERIGNFITFRPAYRWSGSRELSPAAWSFAVDLLNRLGLDYALMVDGRELPGKRICPGHDLLAGPGYLGRQSHEADGAFNYWGNSGLEDPLFCQLMQRSSEPDGIFPGVRPSWCHGRFFRFHAPNRGADMKSGAEYFVQNLRLLSKTASRHTGPSALFRYFYQAGFQFLGAEQMYAAEDVILAALRGASRAYGKPGFGAHLAVQWSSTPLDEPAHFRRYFLALASCYLQGVTQINTEEGLYRMENLFAREDRFGKACTGHREYHARFRRFLETHERRGTMRVPLGILHGRYDGWTCFTRGRAWDQEDPSMRFGRPEESFDLLKVFYPRCRMDAIYREHCPPEPQGWYSGTPYGPVDILPVEAAPRVLQTYKALAFLGWNTFHEGEFANLVAFVKAGGTLLLTRPHAATNIRRGEPAQLPASPALRELLGPAIKTRTRVERKLGRGKVIFHGQDTYPADPAVRPAYESDLHALARQVVAEERARGWIAGNEDIDFAVYDHGDVRTIYLLNIAWWRPGIRKATLLLGRRTFPLTVPFGSIRVLTIAGPCGIYPEHDDVDLLDVGHGQFTFQADGPSRFTIFNPQGTLRLTASPGTVVLPSAR